MGGKGVISEGQCHPNIKNMPVEGLDGLRYNSIFKVLH